MHRVFDRSAEYLSIGKVFCASAVDPFPAAHAIADVGAGGDDVNFIVPLKKLDDTLLFHVYFAPGRNRIIQIEQTYAIDKIFIITERHARVLRAGMGRKQGAAPAYLAICHTLERAFEKRGISAALQGHTR